MEIQYMEYKNWWESKLLWYAVITGIAGALSVLTQEYPQLGVLAVLNATVVAVLRVLTVSPIK